MTAALHPIRHGRQVIGGTNPETPDFSIPVLLGITVIVFLIMAMIPGDPATAILGSFAIQKTSRNSIVTSVSTPPWCRDISSGSATC